MIINHNMRAINTHRQMGGIQVSQSKNMEKLSSGYRINRAGDDAAGLAISEKMRGQVRGLNQATRNAQDGISLIQTAEGALAESQNIVQRMRELAIQSANDTNEQEDREALQNEINELTKELDRVSTNTEFNKKVVLSGDFKADGGKELKFHVGANENQVIGVNIEEMTAHGLGLRTKGATGTAAATPDTSASAAVASTPNTGLAGSIAGTPAKPAKPEIFGSIDLTTHSTSEAAIAKLDTANQKISGQRAKLGAIQNRLEHTIVNDQTSAENLQAAESRIRDVDMAKEMMDFTKNNILAQASQSMLAQANQAPQQVLQLLR